MPFYHHWADKIIPVEGYKLNVIVTLQKLIVTCQNITCQFVLKMEITFHLARLFLAILILFR